jgi:hypothetical protein
MSEVVKCNSKAKRCSASAGKRPNWAMKTDYQIGAIGPHFKTVDFLVLRTPSLRKKRDTQYEIQPSERGSTAIASSLCRLDFIPD